MLAAGAARAVIEVRIVPADTGLSTELRATVERAAEYVEAAAAENTRRAYASDWRQFARWCDAYGTVPLPAAPATVCLYITALASGQVPARSPGHPAVRRPSTIGRALAAIRKAHEAADMTSPVGSREVRAVLAGIRRTHGVAPRKKAAAVADILVRLVATLPDEPRGWRDRALLTLGFAGAFRRSELVALDVEDLEFLREGILVYLRRSKTDQEGLGRKVPIPYGASGRPESCPVRSVQRWLEYLAVLGASQGALFRSTSRRNAMHRLSGRAVARAVQRAAEAAGLDPKNFGGHSLRAGFVTTAARRGKRLDAIRAKTGHKSLDMLAEYIRAEGDWQDDAGEGLL